MHIILGATGHVGSALANALLDRGEPVTVVTRDPDKAQALQRKGAQVAVADAHDADALRRVFRTGKRLFLLNPPAAPSTDTDMEERSTLAAILAALDGSGLDKIVAESTYGAQPTERSGDLGILYGMEQALDTQPIPASIIRAAYYMSNWDASLQSAREEGVVHTMYPADFALPMVAPHDLGQVAADLLLEPAEHVSLQHVEGPRAYTSRDVARAFSAALGKPVEPVVTPRDQWLQAFQAIGFSDTAAASYAAMTALTLDGKDSFPDKPVRGNTTLEAYIEGLASGHRS